MVGKTIGGYRILEEIGNGSAGVVYKAVQVSLDRFVALKILHRELGDDPEFLARFHREAGSCANLSHPNIVQIYDVGMEEEGVSTKSSVHYIAMEYCSGTTLSRILKAEHMLNVTKTGSVLSQIALGLDYIHKHGFVHRDIKPANIMINDDCEVKITDLGIAKLIDATGITVPGTVLGTPEYMSPEQIKGEKVDTRTDIYSLGILIYEMLTGQLPFRSKNPLALARQHVSVVPTRLRSINRCIPLSIESVVLKAIAKSPGDRYESSLELLRDWEKAVEFSACEHVRERSRIPTFVFRISLIFLIAVVCGFALLRSSKGVIHIASVPRHAEMYAVNLPRESSEVSVIPLNSQVQSQKSETEINGLSERVVSPACIGVEIQQTGDSFTSTSEVPESCDREKDSPESSDLQDLEPSDISTSSIPFTHNNSFSPPFIKTIPLPPLLKGDKGGFKGVGEICFAKDRLSPILVGKVTAVNRAAGRVVLRIRRVREGDMLQVVRGEHIVASLKVIRVYDFHSAICDVHDRRGVWRIRAGDFAIGER